MKDHKPTPQEIDQTALRMAEALRDMDFPKPCGPIHGFTEVGAQVYR